MDFYREYIPALPFGAPFAPFFFIPWYRGIVVTQTDLKSKSKKTFPSFRFPISERLDFGCLSFLVQVNELRPQIVEVLAAGTGLPGLALPQHG